MSARLRKEVQKFLEPKKNANNEYDGLFLNWIGKQNHDRMIETAVIDILILRAFIFLQQPKDAARQRIVAFVNRAQRRTRW
jgi:hypothetical protein